ncbi:MAG: gfo/Idh/MocA family oxidoreductase, partial [Candidatus Marinimicrobia bacterium]|nr:gfo/Idh/MocA family oxidoreductase [Candidatus Neomarinimicrobiota bacterium]
MNHVRTLNELHSLGGIVELDDEKRNHVRKQFPEIEIF